MDLVITLSYLLLLAAAVTDAPPARVPAPLPGRAVTACLAVTKADIEQALGRPVSTGKEEKSGGESTCDYAGGLGHVTITVERLEARLDVPAELESLKALVPEATQIREITGIGSRAFFLDIGEAGTQLHVIRGEREYVLVSVLGFGNAGKVSAAVEALARKALTRL
jgi:hypothetical protein